MSYLKDLNHIKSIKGGKEMKQLLLVLFCIMLIVGCRISYIESEDVLIVTKIDEYFDGTIYLKLERFPNQDIEGDIIKYITKDNNYKVGDKFKLVKIEEYK